LSEYCFEVGELLSTFNYYLNRDDNLKLILK